MKTPISGLGGQVLVALAIVAGMTALGISLVVAAVVTKNPGLAVGGVATIIGALAAALNTPTGVSAALTAAKTPAPPSEPSTPQQ